MQSGEANGRQDTSGRAAIFTAGFHFINRIELIRRANVQIIAASEEGVLLLETTGDIYMLAASHLGAACTLLHYAAHPLMLVVHQEFCCAEVQRQFGYTTAQEYIQMVYYGKN